jgi:hypothetical protein
MLGSGARRKCGGAVVASLLGGRVPRLVETKEQAGVSGHRPIRVTRHYFEMLRFRDLPRIDQFITKGFESPDQLVAVMKGSRRGDTRRNRQSWQTPDNPPMWCD